MKRWITKDQHKGVAFILASTVVFGEAISWQSVAGSITVLGACVVVLLRSNNN